MRLARIGAFTTTAAALVFGLLWAGSTAEGGDAPKNSSATAAEKRGELSLKDALEGLEGKGELRARIETNHGVMVARLFEKRVPNTVANFVGLARGKKAFLDPKSGEWVKRPFYDGLTFHRVMRRFMIQGGDPSGDGTGGPGYKFGDELYPTLKHDKPGILSMANSGPNTNGSQFFVTEVPTPHLDGRHAVFGELVEGLDIVRKIARVKTGSRNRPEKPVVIKSVTVFRAS